MPKHKIGLQKDVSSIFKGVPPICSGDDQVATIRRMPVLDPPGYAPATPQPSEVSKDSTSGGSPGAVVSEKSPSVEPQAQSVPETTSGGSIPKVTAPKKHKTALAMKAPRHATGGILKSLQQIKEKLLVSKPGVSQTRQKAMMVLVPVLAIVLVFVLIQVVSPPSHSMAMDRQESTANSASDSGGEINWKIPALYQATLRDPMQDGALPPAQAKSQEPQADEPESEKLIVRSILHTQDRPSAVIGDQIAHQGDVIMGATIVKINKDEVEFEKDGKTWTQKIEN